MSQDKLFEKKKAGPVTCLGMTFESDEARRQHFTNKLREKLKDPDFKKIEGFPIAQDEDILALSDPPYYTACPNPFIEEFIKLYGKHYDPETDDYLREPFASDVSEGKRDPLYEHYSYHTKVPYQAVARYIAHFTNSGDIVIDAFSGSGMTGLAVNHLAASTSASPCGSSRLTLLTDISSYASFIGHHFSGCKLPGNLENDFRNVMHDYQWMYLTRDKQGVEREVNYYVWSDVFLCCHCGTEITFFNDFVHNETGDVVDNSNCPKCRALINKNELVPIWHAEFDDLLGETVKKQKQTPVLVKYFVGNKQFFKLPDEYDFELIDRINRTRIPCWVPVYELPRGDNTDQPRVSHGITHSHMFFTKRNLISLSLLWNVAKKHNDSFWMFEILGGFRVWTRRAIFLTTAWKQGGTGAFKPSTSGILYVPSISGERNVFKSFIDRYKKSIRFAQLLPKPQKPIVSSTASATNISYLPSNSVDYAFVDPPFGGNIMYSELNMVFEPWLKVMTAVRFEAVCNRTLHKTTVFYTQTMSRAFAEIFRALKPSRWLSVEFHNSKNVIWNSIQESLQRAGFIIGDIRILDKKQGTFKQYTASNTVKKDLVISAYKPADLFTNRFDMIAGSEEGVWNFVRTHMRQLSVFVVTKDQCAEVINERQAHLLFDRMVAFHVQRAVSVPLSAAEFYAGLAQRFPERDGMWFLPEQVVEYDRKRMATSSITQPDMFVLNEDTAIRWLRQKLSNKPQTFQEIHPQFMREIGGWQKHEKPLELMDMLEQNFIKFDNTGTIPSQIVSWLKCSEKYRQLINQPETSDLTTNNAILLSAAKDRWYVPDPNKQIDLEKVREKALLKEFEEYKSGASSTGTSGAKKAASQKLKVFRIEAVRAGFKKAYQDRDYQNIISVAKRIPETVLQEDDKLLMWYDQALTRTEG